MKVEEAKGVRIVASARIGSLSNPMENGCDVMLCMYFVLTADVAYGVNTHLLRQRRGFDSRTVQTRHVNEHVCLYWVWVFLCIICMY
jgi:hypothetical protein